MKTFRSDKTRQDPSNAPKDLLGDDSPFSCWISGHHDRYLKLLYSVVACGFLLPGCATEPSVIFNKVNLGSEEIHYTTDARQRIVTTQRPKLTSRPGTVDPFRLTCVEPSPDVAVAVANSLSTGLSLLNYGSGSFNASSAQGLVQLAERTVSIQLMQMLMFRACEAYTNGAISGTSYSLLMSRIGETMITLSLGETAGGNFGRSLGSAGGNASGSASASLTGLPGAFNGVQDAISRLAKAEEAVQSAEADLASAKKAQESLPGDATDTQKKQAADLVSEKTAVRDKAIGERNALRSVLNTEVKTAANAAATAAATGAGGIAAKPDAAVARILADMQGSYLDRRPVLTYVDACLVELGLGTEKGIDQQLQNLAIENLADIVAAHSQKGQPLGTEVEAAVRLAWTSRQSGLYAHCKDNLHKFIDAERKDHYNLRARQLENQRADNDGRHRVGEAMAKIDPICTKLEGDAQKTCQAIVKQLRQIEVSQPVPAPTPQPSPKPAAESAEVLPTVAFDAAKPLLADLNASIGNLDQATMPSAGPTLTKGDLEALTKRRQDALKQARVLTGVATNALSDNERLRLRQLEQKRSELVGNVKRSADKPVQNKRDLAALAKHDSDAAYEEKLLKDLSADLKTESKAVVAAIEAIAKAGK